MKYFIPVLLAIIFVLFAQDKFRVKMSDNSVKEYDVDRIEDVTFSNITGYIKVNMSDGSYKIYSFYDLQNMTFSEFSGIEEGEEAAVPEGISLITNYPNPFNPETVIEFTLHDPGITRVEIYNTNGQKIETLHDGKLNNGLHKIKWNASESAASSGTYLVKVIQNEKVKSSRMLLLK